MYKKFSKEDKVTRVVNENYKVDNYLTKEVSENISMAVSHLNGKIINEICENERVYYFLNANGEFIIDGEKVNVTSGDILYIPMIELFRFNL